MYTLHRLSCDGRFSHLTIAITMTQEMQKWISFLHASRHQNCSIGKATTGSLENTNNSPFIPHNSPYTIIFYIINVIPLLLVYSMQTFHFAGDSRSRFCRSFTEMASDIVIFRSFLNNYHRKLFLGHIFESRDERAFVEHIFKLAEELSINDNNNRAHVLLSMDLRKTLKRTDRLRFDIFNRNLIVFTH